MDLAPIWLRYFKVQIMNLLYYPIQITQIYIIWLWKKLKKKQLLRFLLPVTLARQDN
ncbi:hypothetical protein PCASD_26156, partial [Puccinia coronata f. sp. avenae]